MSKLISKFIKKVFADINDVDDSKYTYTIEKEKSTIDEKGNYIIDSFVLQLYNSENEWVGYIGYATYKIKDSTKPTTDEDIRKYGDHLYISNVKIGHENEGKKLSYVLWKKFAEVYAAKYTKLPIVRFFVNPVAEYVFKQMVANGYFPQETANEKYFTRSYSPQEVTIWKDLRKKLPENLQGTDPAKWAKRTIQLKRTGE